MHLWKTDRCICCAATTASAVLNCEGALPKLLQLLHRTPHAEKLTHKVLTASAQVTLTHVPSLDEIKQVIDEVRSASAVPANGAFHVCLLAFSRNVIETITDRRVTCLHSALIAHESSW